MSNNEEKREKKSKNSVVVIWMMGVKPVLSSNCKYNSEVRLCSGSSDWILTKYGDNEVNSVATK